MIRLRRSRGLEQRRSRDSVFLLGEWTFDMQSEILTCSEDCHKLFAIPNTASVVPQTIMQSVHPNDEELVKTWWKLVGAGNFIDGITFRIINDGERYLYSELDYKIGDDGQIVSVSGKTRDVTDLMTEDELLPSTADVDNDSTDSYSSIHIDRDLRIVKVSPMAEQLFGWTEQELRLQMPIQLIPALHWEAMQSIYETVLADGGFIRVETMRIHKNGIPVQVGVTLYPVHDLEGGITGVVARYSKSFANNESSTAMLSTMERGLQALVENSFDVCMILSKEYDMNYVTHAITNVLGYSAQEFISLGLGHVIHPEDVTGYLSVCHQAVHQASSQHTCVARFKHKNGEWRYCSTRIRYLTAFYSTEGIIVNFHDVTESRRAEELMKHMTFHDSLTSLPNRKHLEERLQLLIGIHRQREEKLAVLRLDINRFKYINSSLGRTTGDHLIRDVADALRQLVPTDCVVSRTGENEFSMVVPYVHNMSDVLQFARQVVDSFDTPFQIGDYALAITCNVGISTFPEDGENTEALLKTADMALHDAQLRGVNQIELYSQSLDAKAYKEFTLSNDFKNAINEEQFVIYFQPRVAADTRSIVAAEALIRWQHPEWGLVSPGEFLYLAEQTGSIVLIGQWVLRQVCHHLQQWKQQGQKTLKVSVNFSAQQLKDPNTVETVKTILHEYGIEPALIEIEITETSILPNDPAIINSIRVLRNMGIGIYFDDFGTGYSSLSWLYQFELDGIKLDKMFMSHIPDSPVPAQIVSSVMKLAHSLNLTVVAEGIETNKQLEFLSNLQCEEIQGYLFSRPLPAEEFTKLLQRGEISVRTGDNSAGMDKERRRFFRVELQYPIKGKMTVSKIKSKQLNVGYSPVLVYDIGPGGLRVLTDLKLPIGGDLELEFKVQVLGEELQQSGYVVWKQEYSQELFQYGVEFETDETARERLVRLFDELDRVTRSELDIPGTHFYSGTVDTFFKK
ncbi:EAL domain-containing protein [Alicyclobacillus sp. SO9]|uniref:EAL domain-containing protein n=1 Tax=Alicyclobacillus sp. SO9 TaxID=2665646 RepID=UPI0018E829C6|nr:EAL domain-containing protein [Alicyclobacillus sp. SO9]QQE80955.1 EAL domain-containing protein [Alicyclobacillus sp. SO9]